MQNSPIKPVETAKAATVQSSLVGLRCVAVASAEMSASITGIKGAAISRMKGTSHCMI